MTQSSSIRISEVIRRAWLVFWSSPNDQQLQKQLLRGLAGNSTDHKSQQMYLHTYVRVSIHIYPPTPFSGRAC